MDLQHESNRIFANDASGKLIAEITFPEEGGVATINHTFVDDSLRGQGVAGQLMTEAVKSIKESGWKLEATCSYAQKWLSNQQS